MWIIFLTEFCAITYIYNVYFMICGKQTDEGLASPLFNFHVSYEGAFSKFCINLFLKWTSKPWNPQVGIEFQRSLKRYYEQPW